METYVSWDIFIWTVGIITGTITITMGYVIKLANDISLRLTEEKNEIDERLTDVEKCHTDNQVNLAKISKDIEYIKVKQNEISLSIKEINKYGK
jgi:hypothetical protein